MDLAEVLLWLFVINLGIVFGAGLYAALLEVTPTGFICRYPGLWEAEP